MWVGKEFKMRFFSLFDGGVILFWDNDLVFEGVVIELEFLLMVEFGGRDWKVVVKLVLYEWSWVWGWVVFGVLGSCCFLFFVFVLIFLLEEFLSFLVFGFLDFFEFWWVLLIILGCFGLSKVVFCLFFDSFDDDFFLVFFEFCVGCWVLVFIFDIELK